MLLHPTHIAEVVVFLVHMLLPPIHKDEVVFQMMVVQLMVSLVHMVLQLHPTHHMALVPRASGA